MSKAPEVLVIDDDRDQRAGLRELLEERGCFVSEATSGRQALTYLLESQAEPALIVLDLVMPDMGGAQLLELLWTYTRLSSIPVVVISATDPNRVPLKRPVARRFVKPVHGGRLLAAIEELIMTGPQT